MPNEIIKTIDIDAPVERVWRAITDHVEFGQWFGVRLEAPFAPGKQAKGAITHPGYEHVTMTVTVAETARLAGSTWRAPVRSRTRWSSTPHFTARTDMLRAPPEPLRAWKAIIRVPSRSVK